MNKLNYLDFHQILHHDNLWTASATSRASIVIPTAAYPNLVSIVGGCTRNGSDEKRESDRDVNQVFKTQF